MAAISTRTSRSTRASSLSRPSGTPDVQVWHESNRKADRFARAGLGVLPPSDCGVRGFPLFAPGQPDACRGLLRRWTCGSVRLRRQGHGPASRLRLCRYSFFADWSARPSPLGFPGGALASGFGPSWSKRSLIAARWDSRRSSVARVESESGSICSRRAWSSAAVRLWRARLSLICQGSLMLAEIVTARQLVGLRRCRGRLWRHLRPSRRDRKGQGESNRVEEILQQSRIPICLITENFSGAIYLKQES